MGEFHMEKLLQHNREFKNTHRFINQKNTVEHFSVIFP